MSNAAEIQAKLGLNISGFQQALREAEKQSEASAGKMSAAQKKAAAEAEKAAKKASADAAKAAKEREAAAERLKSQAQGAAGDLLNAGSATDVLAAGVARVGQNLKLGVIGGVALTVVTSLIGKIEEAVESAKKFRNAMNEALKPRGSGAQSTLGELQAQLGKTVEAGNIIQERGKSPISTAVNDAISNTYHRTASGLFGAAEVEGQSAEQDAAKQRAVNAAAQADVDRITAKTQALAEIEEIRITQGERAAKEKQIELERLEKIGAALNLAKETQEKGGVSISTVGLSKEINSEADFQKSTAGRLDDEAQRAADDAAQTARDQVDIASVALRNETKAAEQEIDRLDREAKKKRGYADKTDNVEKKRGYNTEADQLETQAVSARVKLEEQSRSLEEKNVDLARARQQAQVETLSLTGQEVAARAQMDLLTKRIDDNLKRRDYRTKEGKLQIDAENAALEAQIKKLALAEQMKTPAQKAQERANSRKARRAMRVVEAKAADQARSVKNGGSITRRGDAVLRALNRPVEPAPFPDIGKSLDQSQLAKDIGSIAKALLFPPKAG